MKRSLILSAVFWCVAATLGHAQPAVVRSPNPALSAAAAAPSRLSPQELQVRRDWQRDMSGVRAPQKGCFAAVYPSRQWQRVDCKPPPPYPMEPRNGPPPPFVVGAGDDISAGVPASPGGLISTGIGTFDSVSGVTGESSPIANAGPSVADAYTLQLNTNFFSSTTSVPCQSAAVPANCSGWEQFVFFNDGTSGSLFIQYWMLDFGMNCPANWGQFQFTGNPTIFCVRNASAGAMPVANQPIGNLAQLSLTGTAITGSDQATLLLGGTVLAMVTGDDSVTAHAGWTEAEFNIFGAAGNSNGGGTASFNAGSTIVPRTRIFYGGNSAPDCVAAGFTAEKNNLSFGPSPPALSGPGPAVFFTQSSNGGAASNCAAATTIGDTHLETFAGLHYDFQAAGDFVLARLDPGFEVQARQVSGAPTWPNATVNHAIATRMGKERVAICLGDRPLNVDGRFRSLADGRFLSLAGGVNVWRRGNVYYVVDSTGNSVRAEINPTWINVSVGLGRWPSAARGLLGSPDGRYDQIQSRDGTNFSPPFAFDDLYGRYADSWRVPADGSLVSACDGKDPQVGRPGAIFYAKDLDPGVYQRTRAICLAAGVTSGPLLDDCALDVAVIGDNKAANAFVGARTPALVGLIVGGPGMPFGTTLGADHGLPCLLILLLLLICSILLVWLGRSASGALNILKWLVVGVSWLIVAYCLAVLLGLFRM